MIFVIIIEKCKLPLCIAYLAKKLIRRWDSKRELSVRRHRTRIT